MEQNEGKTYHWCINHQSWTHKSEDYKGWTLHYQQGNESSKRHKPKPQDNSSQPLKLAAQAMINNPDKDSS
jgi:hypothetical protein